MTAVVFPSTADAAFPGRDGLIAFTRAVGIKPGQIYLVRPNGHGLRRLTHRRRGAGAPAWAPGGRRLAFSAPTKNSGHIFVRRLGGGTRQITHGKDTFEDPTWSPSGRRIAAIRGHWAQNGFHYDALVVMHADGSHRRVVFAGGDRLSSSSPSWAPDGRTIAFEHTDIGGTGADPDIYVVPAGGGTPRLVTDVGSQEHPDWSPDGRLIAYTYGQELSPDDIRVVRPDRTGDAPVTNDVSIGDGWPAWAPSGRRLAISRQGKLWTVAPDGSGLRQLTRGTSFVSDWDPSWQPR